MHEAAAIIRSKVIMPDNTLLRLSAQIVAAHAGHNRVSTNELPAFIRIVYEALHQVGTPKPAAETLMPAVPIKKSVFSSYLVCLEDGKKLKMLKRHLQTVYGMTPDDYRAKWSLPNSYPMVAPDYSARRSVLAKEIGLGRSPDEIGAEIPVQKIAEGVRGKKPKQKKTAAAPDTEATSEIST